MKPEYTEALSYVVNEIIKIHDIQISSDLIGIARETNISEEDLKE